MLTRVRAASFELLTALLLFGVWQIAVVWVSWHTNVSSALRRGRELWAVERWLHLPSEVVVQRPFLALPGLLRVLDDAYVWVHPLAFLAVAVWLAARHRQEYRAWRWLVVVSTLCAFVVQLVPVAPPRLLGVPGLVDTAAALGQSEYGSHAIASLTAFPSLHVAWAVLAAAPLARLTRLGRAAWLYPAAVVLLVVITGNHTWLDCAAGAAVVGVAGSAIGGYRGVTTRVRNGSFLFASGGVSA